MKREPITRLSCTAVGLAAALVLVAAYTSTDRASQVAGAVTSAERASTEIGLDVLRRGGNAADAAVATALAMAVVHPQAGNLGGGGFALVRFAGAVSSLDFRETASERASRDMYLDSDGLPKKDASLVGPLASGVPGTPAGLKELHRRFGSLPWADVVEPARRLAADGFIVSDRLAASLQEERALLERFPETAAVWLPDGEPLRSGTELRLPDLARSLAAYARDGADALTHGEIVPDLLAAIERHGGVLTADDLASYRPLWRPPLEFEAFGWSFAAMDLPSSGGYLLAATLKLAERLGYAADLASVERSHLLAEVWRRIYADRAHLGEPESTKVETRVLLEPARLAQLATTIDLAAATPSVKVRGWPDELPTAPRSESDETVHLAVVDGAGNVVSLTTTLNGTFGCGLWVPGAGYFLNNEMDDFAVAPGHPNMFGLVQGPANEIAPGRRMLSSMVPTIGWRGDELLALGGRGGSRIPTAVAQVVLNLLVAGDDLNTAVSRPRIHHQWMPDQILAEEGALDPETERSLATFGHTIEVSERSAKVNVARRLADGSLEAVGDPRGPAVGGVAE